jgi:hypothetical protein
VRKPGGAAGSGQDTDANDADFLAPATPAFHSSASPPANPPTLLGNVRATLWLDHTAEETELLWGAAAGAIGYRVYRGTVASFMGAGPTPWTTPAVPRVVDAENPAGCFYYVVRATDGTAESSD